jgi:glycosyltransferase involved in cell wall biosynthesis
MKILLSCSNEHPGVRTHLLQLQKILPEKTVFCPLEDCISFLPNYRKMSKSLRGVRRAAKWISKMRISKRVAMFGNGIILGGWHPWYHEMIVALNKMNIRPCILWCSTIGQTEMTWKLELNRFLQILAFLKKGMVRYLFVPEKTFESIGHLENVEYLPHPISLKICAKTEETVDKENKHVDLFMKVRPGKNALQQIIAKKYTNEAYELHTNIRDEVILSIAREFGIPFTGHSWLPEDEYFKLISQMDASLQVTWTESFNYAVCERMILGIPTLVSPEVFLIYDDEVLREHLVVERPDSPLAIGKKLEDILKGKALRKDISERGKQRVREVAERYNAKINDQMEHLFS